MLRNAVRRAAALSQREAPVRLHSVATISTAATFTVRKLVHVTGGLFDSSYGSSRPGLLSSSIFKMDELSSLEKLGKTGRVPEVLVSYVFKFENFKSWLKFTL